MMWTVNDFSKSIRIGICIYAMCERRREEELNRTHNDVHSDRRNKKKYEIENEKKYIFIILSRVCSFSRLNQCTFVIGQMSVFGFHDNIRCAIGCMYSVIMIIFGWCWLIAWITNWYFWLEQEFIINIEWKRYLTYSWSMFHTSTASLQTNGT